MKPPIVEYLELLKSHGKITLDQETSWHTLKYFNICIKSQHNPEIILDHWWACSCQIGRLDDRLFGGVLDRQQRTRMDVGTGLQIGASFELDSMKYVRRRSGDFDLLLFLIVWCLAPQVVANPNLSLLGVSSACLHFVLASVLFSQQLH